MEKQKQKKNPKRDVVKAVRQRFFEEFVQFHNIWLRELVRKYKEHGVFPVFPTQIIDYYPDKGDKEIAIFSTLCMNWKNGKELEQIASMRQLMGDRPAIWFANREFVTLSIGRMQDYAIDGYQEGRYWKIAKVFSMLYDFLNDGRGARYPSDVFTSRKFADFCQDVAEQCEITDMDYKHDVIEMVLRTSDGIGRKLWPTMPGSIKCPVSGEIKRYMAQWFPFWRSGLWTWDEAVKLFNLEHDYDFFYAWLAHKELARLNPKACMKYAGRYHSRIELHTTFPAKDWKKDRGMQPDINFETENYEEETDRQGISP